MKVIYVGQKNREKVLVKVLLKIRFSIKEDIYETEQGEIVDAPIYELKFADEKEIQKQITDAIKEAVGKIRKEKITSVGGNSLIGFPNSLYTKKHDSVYRR